MQEASSIASKILPEGIQPTASIDNFVSLTTELCWLMSIQDPPMFMKTKFKKNEPFEKQTYSEYTCPGDKNDYLVWPPLFLYQGGGLVCKGIAQPKCTVTEDKRTDKDNKDGKTRSSGKKKKKYLRKNGIKPDENSVKDISEHEDQVESVTS